MISRAHRIIPALTTVLGTLKPATVAEVFVGFDAMPADIPSHLFPYLCFDLDGRRPQPEAFEATSTRYKVLVELGQRMRTGSGCLLDIWERWDDILAVVSANAKLCDVDGVMTDRIIWSEESSGLLYSADTNRAWRYISTTIEFVALEFDENAEMSPP